MKRIKINRAVSVLIYRDGKFLVLKDKNSDWWMPPGGQVEKNEFLIDALQREIVEETGLKKIKILIPFIYWQGLINNNKREGICFLAIYQGGKIKLSLEHSQYAWLKVNQIKKLKITHNPKHFLLAEKIIKLINKLKLKSL
ncbi:MAG: NUDIX domain-containing protein [Patescibacteria group bacterium]